MKPVKLFLLFLGLLTVAACGGSASDLLGTRIDKTYQVQGINNSINIINITRSDELVGPNNQVLPAIGAELDPVELSFDHVLHERTVTYIVFENLLERDRVDVTISGDKAQDTEDWIVLRWDGVNLTSELSNDPQ